MRSRFIFSLFSIVLAGTLVVGGFSLAWFSDEDTPPTGPALVTGTVDYEITDAELVGSEEDEVQQWKPGESRDFSWTLENTGSKAALYRAQLIETVERTESAWGNGAKFSDLGLGHGQGHGNWGMYFTYEDDPTELDLIACKHEDAGTVKVWSEGGQTFVTITTNDQWKMLEAHVHLANDLKEFVNNGGNPAPGQFDHKNGHLNRVDECTFNVTNTVPEGGTVYVAAHATLIKAGQTDTSESEVQWSLTDDSEAVWTYSLEDGWWYYCGPPVSAGETVGLELTGYLPDDEEDVESGYYTVILEAEAVQASNNAVDHVWPNHPCDGDEEAIPDE